MHSDVGTGDGYCVLQMVDHLFERENTCGNIDGGSNAWEQIDNCRHIDLPDWIMSRTNSPWFNATAAPGKYVSLKLNGCF